MRTSPLDPKQLYSATLLILTISSACGGDDSANSASEQGESATETGEETDSTPSGNEETGTSGDGDGDGDADPATGDGDGDGTTTGDGDGDGTTGDGDGDSEETCGDGTVSESEACDDGVNDGAYGGCSEDCQSLADHCGDGLVNGPESCDDQNEDNTDGCLGSCEVPMSCLDILNYDDSASSGTYMIAPVEVDSVFEVDCDMDTDGGGWTGLSLANTCSDLEITLTAIEPASIEGIDDECRPFTRDLAGEHTYTFDIGFPPGFESFYLADYVVKANSGPGDFSEIPIPSTFFQTQWDIATMPGGVGDISFGDADSEGPTTSYAAENMAPIECFDCETPFPAGSTIYTLEAEATTFRIGWGESGGQSEGWYPWWSGKIYLR